MGDETTMHDYRDKTRPNVQKLLSYLAELKTHLPIERGWLWSEGEADFEAILCRIHSA